MTEALKEKRLKALKENIKRQLKYLRGELRAGTMSYEELFELQSLAAHIADGDLELQEAAGIPEDDAR